MVGICFEFDANPLIRDQWMLLIDAFGVTGYERNCAEPDRDDIENIKSFRELPQELVVLVTPKDGRFVQGEISLREFQHPDEVIYVFGSDRLQWKEEFEGPKVYVDVKKQLWSSQVASMVLYDRMVKNGDH